MKLEQIIFKLLKIDRAVKKSGCELFGLRLRTRAPACTYVHHLTSKE